MTTGIELLIYRLKQPYHLIKTGLMRGLPAWWKTGRPDRKLQIITITGTDGKTTTSTLLYHMLLADGIKAGLISTVGAFIGSKQLDTGLHVTSPSPDLLFQILSRCVKAGCTHVVVELTSHGHYQFRDFPMRVMASGLTNVTHEHLDYHVDFNHYLAAKIDILRQAKYACVPADELQVIKLLKNKRKPKLQLTPVYHKLPPDLAGAIKTRFPESYNRQNAALAYQLANLCQIKVQSAVHAVKFFPGIVGRNQVITNSPKRVIVDFAHTPNGLREILTNTRKTYPHGRLIVVFGCAGFRDWRKRPKMAQIATQIADYCVFTAEDPRRENVYTIFRQMKEQLSRGHDKIVTIADRGHAIAFAIRQLAKRADTVLICGKGHEQSMCLGDIEYPWSDAQIVQQILDKPKITPHVGAGELLS